MLQGWQSKMAHGQQARFSEGTGIPAPLGWGAQRGVHLILQPGGWLQGPHGYTCRKTHPILHWYPPRCQRRHRAWSLPCILSRNPCRSLWCRPWHQSEQNKETRSYEIKNSANPDNNKTGIEGMCSNLIFRTTLKSSYDCLHFLQMGKLRLVSVTRSLQGSTSLKVSARISAWAYRAS